MTKRTKKRINTLFGYEELDIKTFRTLFRAVMRYGLNDNATLAGRLLGVSPRKIRAWINAIDDDEPLTIKGIWWNDILQKLAADMANTLSQHSRKAYRERAYRLKSELRGLKLAEIKYTPDGKPQELPDPTLDSEAPRLILATLNEAPGQTMTLTQLMRSTALNKRTIRAAADRLCLTRYTKGFGENKQAYYSIPLPSDDYTDEE